MAATPKERAYHQAGHMVAARNSNLIFSSVSIEPGTDGNLFFQLVSGTATESDLRRTGDFVETAALVGLSGLAAEAHLRGEDWFPGSDLDLRLEMESHHLSGLPDLKPGESSMSLPSWRKHAMEFVTSRWPAIESVAAQLMERRKMEANEGWRAVPMK